MGQEIFDDENYQLFTALRMIFTGIYFWGTLHARAFVYIDYEANNDYGPASVVHH